MDFEPNCYNDDTIHNMWLDSDREENEYDDYDDDAESYEDYDDEDYNDEQNESANERISDGESSPLDSSNQHNEGKTNILKIFWITCAVIFFVVYAIFIAFLNGWLPRLIYWIDC
jgi:hypothetical protein